VLPVVVCYGLQGPAPFPLHVDNEQAAQAIFILNVFSVGVLIVARRLEGLPRTVHHRLTICRP
jgi:hypothetical protein